MQKVAPSTSQTPVAGPTVITEQRNALAMITLNRPRALNAVDDGMRAAISSALPGFSSDPIIYAMVIQSSSDRAFCAGGDVRSIISTYRQDPARARGFFAEEYKLDWALECFSKPTAALIDGVVMGSGVGLSAFITHRVAGENYKFGMPETAIGLFPDVGAAYILARLPNEIGLYLGLTGRTIGRADAYALGLVSHCIPAERFEEIRAGLADAWPIDPLLDDRHVDPGDSELQRHALTIANCFSAATVSDIISRLEAVAGNDAAWAQGVRDDLLQRAPLSLEVTLRHIREARTSDIRETLIRDYRLACRFLDDGDFAEGVRAMLIDKDKSPRWSPSSLAEIPPGKVDGYFAPLTEGDLDLPAREILQSK
ncbi:MAG: enoyl-CoA hydratase/isomerase family protein [Alphaproteobacteria bacterium]|nr:enoyl-CoA hydratase/isomerase family protein [Alphaproteobacteria bacterium]